MKKIILFGLVLGLCIVNIQPINQAQAVDVYAHTITLESGWNVFSTPRLVQSHQFSVSEVGSNFDIYLLNPSSASGWSTMADFNQTEFTPLFGYFVNNKTGQDQTLTLNYQQNVEPANRLFNRTLSVGWNIIGVANPSYALRQNDPNSTDTNNVSKILTNLSTCGTTILDFTDDQTEKNSVKVGDSWKQKVFSDADLLNDFRETKAYAVYTTSTCSLSGSQDNSPVTLVSTLGSLTISKKSDSPSSDVILNSSGVTLAKYELVATGENMKVENLRVAVDTSSSSTAFELRNGALYVDGVQVGSTMEIKDINDSTASYTEFALGSTLIVQPGTTKILEIRADIFDTDGTNDIAAGQTLTPRIVIGSLNVQKMSSTGYVNVPDTNISGNTLNIVDVGTISLAKDQAYGSQSIVVPTNARKIGQWSLSGSSTEDINLDTIQVDLTFANAFAAVDLTNIYVMYGSKTSSLKSSSSATAGANTWSISEPLLKNNSMTFAFYGDLATAATDGGTDDTVIAGLKVSGVTASSAQAVNTNSNAVLAGQTITAVTAGTLTVEKDTSTPQAAIAVAGSTPSDGNLKVKLTASNEDIYVKDLTFYTDENTDDAVISSATLWKSSSSTGSYTQVGISKTWNTNSTAPGYVQWSLTGTDRIMVPKNGSVYLLVKPTYVASSEVSVTGQTPRLFLGDLQAEGSSTLVADGSTLTNNNGIIVKANTSATYVDSTDIVNDATVATGDTVFTVSNNVAFSAGDVIFVDDATDTGAWYSGTELMVVLADSGTTLTVKRGAFGTTAGAVTNANKIFRLSGTVATYTYAGVVGNATTVLKDKLTVSVASDTPTGASTGGTQRVIFRFNAAVANNAEDVAENKVVLTSVDITTIKSGITVNNVKLYPSEFDQNATYNTVCIALSQTKWRCTLSTTGATNEVVENGSRTYVVRADVGSGTGTSNTLDVSIASLGSSAANGDVTAGDVVWTDGTTSKSWVNQAGASYIQPASPMTLGASSGTTDATAPTIQALVFGGSATNTLADTDTITITWSERIDPTTINSSLIPGGSAASVNSGTGDVTLAADGVVTVTNIATTDIDGGASTATTYTPTAVLSSDGTTLTITLAGASASGALSGAEILGDITGLTTTIKDVNGNTQIDSAVSASGDI